MAFFLDVLTRKPSSATVTADGRIRTDTTFSGTITSAADSTALKQDQQTAELVAIKGFVDGLETQGAAAATDRGTTNTRLTAIEAQGVTAATARASTNSQLATIAASSPHGRDTVGNLLPLDFATLPESYTYTTGNLTSVVKTKGIATYTQTLAYTGSVLNSVSGWVTA